MLNTRSVSFSNMQSKALQLCYFTLAFFTCVSVVFSNTIHDEMRDLQSQFNALLLQRQEDYKQLETILQSSMNKNSEINELRNEINDLRQECDSLKNKLYSNNADGNRVKNEQLTVNWLANSISEIRAEISELVKSLNSTAELQQRQMFTTDISMLQNDIVSLRHDVEMLKGESTKYVAKLSVFSQDIDSLRQLSYSTAAKMTNFTEKLQIISYDWTRIVKTLRKKRSKIFKKVVVVNENPLEMKVLTVPGESIRQNRRRHEPLSFDPNNALNVKKYLRVVRLSQKWLEERLRDLEEQSKTQIDSRILKLEERTKTIENSVLVVESKTKAQEKLHSSMLELLESVENVETKVDTITPEFKREISKLEFNFSQLTSNTSLLRQEQEEQKKITKIATDNLISMETMIVRHESQISKLSKEVGAISTTCTNTSSENVLKQSESKMNTENISDEQISSTFSTIRLNEERDSFKKQLPRDCNSIGSNKSGSYLITMGGDKPIFVFCEFDTKTNQSYIVIQRRENGKQDFNKNWEEYAAGFGNLWEEFWLGNENIHRLTENNNTKVIIDMKDTFGNFWVAEYDQFYVGSRQEGFILHVSDYSGNASNALEYQNGMQFSTSDSDRDISNTNCAANYEGGWWFSRCQHTNLNGQYNVGLSWFDSNRNEWIAVTKSKIKLIVH